MGDRAFTGQPVIIGAGIAGLMTALRLAPEPVLLLSGVPLGTESSSVIAQGGVAASVGPDDDLELHVADTMAAGDRHGDLDVVRQILTAAPAAIEDLTRLGVPFDREPNGMLRLGLEAAHSRHRIVHAAGDGTGRELVTALLSAVRRTPSITLMEGIEARRLLVEDNAVCGVVAARSSEAIVLPTNRVVLATGGIGALYLDTTNPTKSFGQGLALAARAGAVLADLEFVQFHPTALDGPDRPMKLVSEAVRGDGAILVDETGRRFLVDLPGAELAPRDEVARGIYRHLLAGHRVFLDARQTIGDAFPHRFPTIASYCRAAGIDPVTQPIPVRPAAHYHMGGVAVDAEGRSSISGLWACGEVARTGLHGANRLASNSLIEAVVCAALVAASVAGAAAGPVRRSLVPELPPSPDVTAVRPIMSRRVGMVRDRAGLEAAVEALLALARGNEAAADPATVGLMIAVAALRREGSRGAHYRTDFPERLDLAPLGGLTLESAIAAARELLPVRATLLRSA